MSTPDQKSEFLRTAYGKHAAELVAIDDQQQKLLLVMLGIFGAGATLLASLGKADANTPHHDPSIIVQIGLTLITITLVGLWFEYTKERHEYRQAVRALLVRCEMALGFFEIGAYLPGESLYRPADLTFPTKGHYLAYAYGGSVFLAAAGFSVVLWSARIAKLWAG